MNRKVILFVSPVGEFYGGGERSGFEFCKYLEKNGHKVITAIPKSSKTYKDSLIDSGMEYRLMECGDFESQRMESNPSFLGIVSQLAGMIYEDNVDILITNLYAQVGPVAAILAGIPNISMDRGQAYIDRYFPDFMAKLSDLVVVNSSGLAEIYYKNYSINTPIVYSYTSTPNAGLNSEIKEQRIVCVSRVSPEKNLLEALEAAKILKDSGYNIKIYFIGPVPNATAKDYKKELEQYIEKHNLGRNVVWSGNQDSPWSLVGEYDIYINTSEVESVGRSNIEAIKLGIPSILVDIPGHNDMFDKLNITRYSKGDSADLAKKIENTINNYSDAKKAAIKAGKKAELWISEEGCNKSILPALNNLKHNPKVSSEKLFGYMLDRVNSLIIDTQEGSRANSFELQTLKQELASHLGIKRSARLLAGNIKRRVKASAQARTKRYNTGD